MQERWQLYNEQGEQTPGASATKEEVLGKGLLHAAAHVWIWRRVGDHIEILLQKRAANKRTWPGRYDISAAGHVDAGETMLQAAIREVKEEIGVTITPAKLQFIGTHRWRTTTDDGVSVENEIRTLYLLEIKGEGQFTLADGEVASLEWRPVEVIKQEVTNAHTREQYVPHSDAYFAMLFTGLGLFTLPPQYNNQ